MLSKDLCGILLALRLGIGVRHTNINDAVCATCPEATYENISAVVIDLWIDAFDNVFLDWSRCNWATWVYSGFVANS